MDEKIKREFLVAIKEEPKFLRRVSKRYSKEYNLDLDFYRTAVAYNLDCYEYIPEEYKNDEVIIDILINQASNKHLNINYNKINPNNDDQKEKIKIININISYLYLYQIIFGHDKVFYKEVNLSSLDNNSVVEQLDYVLGCLDNYDKEFITYKFGLEDGIYKSIPATAKYFKLSKLRTDNYLNSIIYKIRKIISNSHLQDVGFYDELGDNIWQK